MAKSKAKAKVQTKTTTSTSRDKHTQKIIGELADLGKTLVNDLKKKQYPSVDMPLRGTTNIIYNEKNIQWSLGEKKVNRSAGSLTGAKPLMYTAWMAKTVQEHLKLGKTSTQREIYYQAMNNPLTKFDDQKDSNNIIVDLETILGRPREDFGIQPGNRNKLYGDMMIEYTDGEHNTPVSMQSSPDGQIIGHGVARAKIVKSNVKMVIILEKEGIFNRCREEGIHKRFNALLFDTSGQATRNTRLLLNRIATELKIPIYIFTDADPWGEHIARVLMGGSAESAHLTGLTIPDAKWLGVWPSDIKEYDLPSLPLTQSDINKCHTMLKDPRYTKGLWNREVKNFLKIKQKAELEAFNKTDFTFITDEYIPAKIKLAQTGKI